MPPPKTDGCRYTDDETRDQLERIREELWYSANSQSKRLERLEGKDAARDKQEADSRAFRLIWQPLIVTLVFTAVSILVQLIWPVLFPKL